MTGLPFGMDIKLAFKGMHLSLLVSVTSPPVRMLVCFLVGRLSRKNVLYRGGPCCWFDGTSVEYKSVMEGEGRVKELPRLPTYNLLSLF